MKFVKFLVVFTVFVWSPLIRAHGEDKPGPHGGFIRMPGAFHTEVILTAPNTVQIYLLDLEWKNPTVKDSSVQVTLQMKKKSNGICEAQADFFICRFDSSVDLKNKGALIVQATRDKQVGQPMTYPLPLKLVGSAHPENHGR